MRSNSADSSGERRRNHTMSVAGTGAHDTFAVD
jgi:hypothetical protein